MRHPGSSLLLLLLASACATVGRTPDPSPQVSATPEAVKQESARQEAARQEAAKRAADEKAASAQQTPSELAAAKPPPIVDNEPRPPRIFGELTLAGGVYEHNTRNDGGVFTGHTDGGFARLRGEYIFERGIGAGLALEGSGSDDKLFGDTGNLDVRGRTSDGFLFFVGEPVGSDHFRLPMRFGPYFHSVVLDDDATSLQTRWNSVGLRVQIEPEVWFVRSDRFSFGMVALASAGAHASNVVLKGGGGRTYLDGSTGGTLGGEAGFQALWGRHVSTKLGYIYRATREGETDANNGVVVRGVNQTFNGIMLSVGVRF